MYILFFKCTFHFTLSRPPCTFQVHGLYLYRSLRLALHQDADGFSQNEKRKREDGKGREKEEEKRRKVFGAATLASRARKENKPFGTLYRLIYEYKREPTAWDTEIERPGELLQSLCVIVYTRV